MIPATTQSKDCFNRPVRLKPGDQGKSQNQRTVAQPENKTGQVDIRKNNGNKNTAIQGTHKIAGKV